MKKFGLLTLIILLMFSCAPIDRGPQLVIIRGVVFGTYYSISYYDDDGTVYQEAIDSLFRKFNRSLSFYDPGSLLSRINRNEETLVDEYFEVVFRRAQEISKETGGAFDATVFPLVDAWGFGFSQRAEMTPEKIDSILQFVGFEKVRVDDGHVIKDDERVQLDFNAIAKGYAADVVGLFLESKGISTYLVEIGGDMMAKGLKPDGTQWRIGLEIPARDMEATQQWDYFVEIKDTGLATSGDYRRYYEVEGRRLSHTIDPETGYPVDHHLMSASVFAPDAMSADAYATAFMVMGLAKAIDFVENRDDLEAYFIFADQSIEQQYAYYASSGLILLTRDDL
ncbi:MAG: FAD:protein FMN transferase [Bacteroidia bacterium]|nr:MAG: FAD:protein FMN transferase [Bacteroidia bacterium]